MNQNQRNYYQILGLTRNAAAGDVEAAFQHMHSLYAPGGSQADPAVYEDIRHAYEGLRDPERRGRYDGLLSELEKPIEAKLQVSKQQLAIIDKPQMVYLLAELRPRDAGEQKVLPLNLCLVVDRSTSMRGERLQRVKNALELLLSKLAAGDKLSVVSFSDRAEVVLPPKPVGEHQKSAAWLGGIEASGGTEIYQGLLSGMKQLRKVSLSEHNNQLILLTDGRTYGDETACLQLAGEAAKQDISIHAFGIGADWDDEFLDALVAPSGGLVEYIDSPQKIVSTLQRRLMNLGETHAHQVTLAAGWPRSVELLDSFRLTPYAQPLHTDGDKIVLGDIEGGAPLSFVLAFSVSPQPIATRIRIPLRFSAEIPGSGIQTFQEQIQLSIVAEPPAAQLPQDIIRAVRLLTLYHLHQRAWQDAESGQTIQAAERMRYLSTRLLEAGETDLALQADIEARQLAQTGNLSALGHKRLKYGTRALTRKALQLEWND